MSGSPPRRRYRSHGRGMTRKELLYAPDPFQHQQAASTARRYAVCDRRSQPVHCEATRKLMYETPEIARSTGQALQRITGKTYYFYPCPRKGKHFHLTTLARGNAVTG